MKLVKMVFSQKTDKCSSISLINKKSKVFIDKTHQTNFPNACKIIDCGPAIAYIKSSFLCQRPSSVFEKSYSVVVHRFIELFFLPISICILIISFLCAKIYVPQFSYDMLILEFSMILMMCVSPLLYLLTFLLHAFNIAGLLATYTIENGRTDRSIVNLDSESILK